MILFKPADEVGNRVNCAVHFLRYMGLGNPTGERKDNGFVFLVVVEENAIDVHYGVGLGLPALTAHKLTDLNRMAEDIYADTGSMDDAILTMAYSYANYAREQYPALTSGAVAANSSSSSNVYTDESNIITSGSSIPAQLGGISFSMISCLCCIYGHYSGNVCSNRIRIAPTAAQIHAPGNSADAAGMAATKPRFWRWFRKQRRTFRWIQSSKNARRQWKWPFRSWKLMVKYGEGNEEIK